MYRTQMPDTSSFDSKLRLIFLFMISGCTFYELTFISSFSHRTVACARRRVLILREWRY